MRHTSSVAGGIACLALLARTAAANKCKAYGLDFQENGVYFQNSDSTDAFSFVTEFSGCNNDTVYNFLIAPDGTEYPCSDTYLQPLNTPALSTCPITKNELTGGDWIIELVSDNDGDSIAYQVDFSLSVGPQVTSTYTPTITITSSIYPVETTTQYTTTETDCVTAPTTTITVPRATIQKTRTHTPRPVTKTVTKRLPTVTETKVKVSVTKKIVTVTATCKMPTRGAPNPVCTKLPKLAQGLLKNPPHLMAVRDVEDFELEKRAPDPQPLVVTDTNPADYQTVTVTETDPCYVTVSASTTITTTYTPTVTIVMGKTKLHPTTVTARTPTRTKTKYSIPFTTTTVKVVKTVTITTTKRPAASKAACRRAGGIYY